MLPHWLWFLVGVASGAAAMFFWRGRHPRQRRPVTHTRGGDDDWDDVVAAAQDWELGDIVLWRGHEYRVVAGGKMLDRA